MKGLRPRLDRLLVTAWTLVALMVTAATLGSARLSSATEEIFENNWRGRYDILVTAPGLEDMVSPGKDAQGLPLLDPNFANVTAPTISLEKLEQIRKLNNIEFAAPIGFLGAIGDVLNWPLFFIPWSELPEPITKFQITWRIVGDDGLGSRLLLDEMNTIVIDYTNWSGESGLLNSTGFSFHTDDPNLLIDGTVTDAGIELSWWPVTVPRSTIFAVDPVAEAALLGKDGEFLKPLADFDDLSAQHGPFTLNGFLGDTSASEEFTLDLSDPIQAQIAEYPGAQRGQRPVLAGSYGVDNPLIGFLRNSQPYAPMDLVVSIDQFHESGLRHVGNLQLDLAAATRPFNGGDLELGWPTGDQAASLRIERYLYDRYGVAGLSPLVLNPTAREDGPNGGVAFEVEPQGFQNAIPQMAFDDLDGTGIGQEQSYRKRTPGTLKLGNWEKAGAAPFEVGVYTPQDLDRTLSYVPLGAYDPGEVVLGSTEQALTPARNALGLAAQPSSALVSLRGAQELTDQDFISAVRIRIAGLEGLTRAEALPHIDTVAAQLRGLGLEAFVVAGASSQPVDLWVPKYAFGTLDPTMPQRVADLGWVSQDFTTLGAVTWSETTTKQVVMMLFAGAISISGVLLIGVGLLARSHRNAEQALLASLGWSRWSRFRWTLLAQWPGLILVLAAGGTGLLVAPSGLRWVIGSFLLMAVIAAAATHPHRPPASFMAGRLGSRRRQIGIAVTETLLTGLAAGCFAMVGAAVGWYQQVTTNTRISTAIGEVLMSFLGVAIPLIVVVLVVQAATAKLGAQLRGQRAAFHYWHLGVARQSLIMGQLLASLPMLAGSLVPPLMVLVVAQSLALPNALAAVLGAGYLLLWAALRTTAVVRWQP